MGSAAVVSGDRVTGSCALHQVPSPSGTPMPAPSPLPFSAPLTLGLARTVLIGGKPAALQGSSGLNTPPHVGLHASDPYLTPALQRGQVVAGSATVLFDGAPAARTGCAVSVCGSVPGQLAGTAATVLIGA